MRADPSDPASRDPDLIRLVTPLLVAVARRYFRVEAEGLERLPRHGPFVCVGNHNGGPVMPDLWALAGLLWTCLGVERPVYGMIHDAPLRVPVLRELLVRLGALRASPENADRVMARGAALLVYPGGEVDALRSFRRRNEVDLQHHAGFVRLAFRHGAPIVPFVNAGGHEVYMTLFSSPRLARWTGLARLTRVKTVPLTLGLPWGLWLTGFVPYLPLPAKLTYRVGEPIHVPHDPERADDEAEVRRTYGYVSGVMQAMLDDLASRRRWPVLG